MALYLAMRLFVGYTVDLSGAEWQIVGRRNSGVSSLKEEVERMFLGEYKHSIDDKGRVTVPARYRELLEEGAYITQGFDRNLMVLQPDTFLGLSEKLDEMSITNAQVRQLRRMLLSRAERIAPDGSGRILVPNFLRQIVDISGDVYLIGSGAFFELWSAETWQQQRKELESTHEDANYFAGLELFANGARD
jgi:MraZ protein